jgi:hypothetical protein
MRVAAFAAAALLAIAVAAGALALVFHSPDGRRAVLVSAGVAFAVQLATFLTAWRLTPRNVVAGWGLGALLRLAALVVYALVVAQGGALPVTAALLSLAVFLFATTLIEPLLLKR